MSLPLRFTRRMPSRSLASRALAGKSPLASVLSLTIAGLLSSFQPLHGQTTAANQPEAVRATIEQQTTSQSVENMVATVHPLATEAGLNALAAGGNAVDAAVAAGLTLGVVDGFNSGIGGGCFILIRTASGELIAIDGREMAPAAAHVDLFREAEKSRPDASRVGSLASGVPGALAAFHRANQRHGKLPFASLVRPAATIAKQGFTVTPAYAQKIASVTETLRQFPGSAAVLLRPEPGQPDGPPLPYRVGERLVQSDLAETYRMIAEQGPAWFYNGPFARRVAGWMRENGGIMTEADLANYEVRIRQPVTSRYRGLEVIGFPPPSSGGVHVAQILNILESYDLGALHERDPAAMYHVIAEAMKFAFADRAEWLGDPDFVDVPKGLIDPAYAAGIARRIRPDQASMARHGEPPRADTELFERHTTHIAAADDAGNWVAITSTVNTTFGSKVIVPGTGVVLNNQMDDFVAIPDQPNAFGLVGGRRNAVAARKRPLSSMSPTILLKDGRPVLTIGAAGGPKIITEVINAIVHHIDLGKSIDQAVAQPRIHHQWSPDVLYVESTFDDAIADRLEQLGHQVRRISAAGICQAIAWDSELGQFRGVADPRTTGAAAGTDALPEHSQQRP